VVAVRVSDGVALLDLLASRGTVAWLVDRDPTDGVWLVVDVSGVDSVMRLLISRGFAVTDDALPTHLEFAHARHGRVTVLACGFAADGSATWHRDGQPVVLPAAAFDPLDAVPRRVRVRLEDGTEVVPADEGGGPGPV
jgi:hypothetical protein